MKKVTILALHLGYGGIENAVATLANFLEKNAEKRWKKETIMI